MKLNIKLPKYERLRSKRGDQLLNKFISNDPNQTVHVVEKIDGSPLAIYIKNNEYYLKNGSKSGLKFGTLSDFQDIINKSFQIYNSLNNVEYIIIFGEIYGDKVCRRCNYDTKINFAAFDIYIKYHEERIKPLMFDDFIEIADKFRMPYATVHFSGNITDAVAHSNKIRNRDNTEGNMLVFKNTKIKDKSDRFDAIDLKPIQNDPLGEYFQFVTEGTYYSVLNVNGPEYNTIGLDINDEKNKNKYEEMVDLLYNDIMKSARENDLPDKLPNNFKIILIDKIKELLKIL